VGINPPTATDRNYLNRISFKGEIRRYSGGFANPRDQLKMVKLHHRDHKVFFSLRAFCGESGGGSSKGLRQTSI